MSGAAAAAQDTVAGELDWTDVWQHALADADAALIARLALDDNNAAVRPLHAPVQLDPSQWVCLKFLTLTYSDQLSIGWIKLSRRKHRA